MKYVGTKMSARSLLLIVGITVMICSKISGIEVLNASVSFENYTLNLSWQVYNNHGRPVYLLNIDEPLIEKKEDGIHLLFRMIDRTKLLITREVPFRSKIKRIDTDSVYDFNLQIGPSRRLETPNLEGSLSLGDIGSFSRITIFLGYTDEDISDTYYEDDVIGSTGRTVFKVKTDDGFKHISEFTIEQIMSMNPEDLIVAVNVQQLINFVITL